MPTVVTLKLASSTYTSALRDAMIKGASKGLYSVALRMVSKIQTEIIPAEVREPSARGVYKTGWRAERFRDGAMYYNSSKVAPLIEYGVRGENVRVGRAMIGGLIEWLRIKGIASNEVVARRIAFAIAMTMANEAKMRHSKSGRVRTLPGKGRGIFKGTGLRIMGKANTKFLDKVLATEVTREVEAAVARM